MTALRQPDKRGEPPGVHIWRRVSDMERMDGKLVYRDLFVPCEVLSFQISNEALKHPGRIVALLPLEEASELNQ